MNEVEPYLLYCPECFNRKDKISLGSITSQGYVILKRKYGRETLIIADEYSLVCDCGYYVRIEKGKMIRDSLHNINLNG